MAAEGAELGNAEMELLSKIEYLDVHPAFFSWLCNVAYYTPMLLKLSLLILKSIDKNTSKMLEHAQVSCAAWPTAPTSTSTGWCKDCTNTKDSKDSISTTTNLLQPPAITHCKTPSSEMV